MNLGQIIMLSTVLILGAFALYYTITTSPIYVVKHGIMYNYNCLAIGKAFAPNFTYGYYESLKTENGRKFVEFNGYVSEKLHALLPEIPVGTFMLFQWGIYADGKTLEFHGIGHLNPDGDVWDVYSLKTILDAIYDS